MRPWIPSVALAGLAVCAVARTEAAGRCQKDYTAQQQELTAARDRWRAAGITTYNYRFSRQCLCDERTAGPFRARVEDGAVRAAIYQGTAANGIPDGTRVAKEFLASVSTVANVFDVIAGAIAKRACTIEVRYDADLGYPTKVDIDFDPDVADEELHFVLSDLRPDGAPPLASPRPSR
jgi:hypothetical protein